MRGRIPIKSVASYAYHQALVRAEHEKPDNEEAWNLALAHLCEQASVAGPDYEARRRAAWVGMCVLKDWSPVVGRMETIGDSVPVKVSLHDYINGPDRILLQQIAAAWDQLRSIFGDELIVRLSGRSEESGHYLAWNSLALVASDNPTLERELENQLVANPQLRTWSGILLWTMRRRIENPAVILEALLLYLRGSEHPLDDPVTYMLLNPNGWPATRPTARCAGTGRTRKSPGISTRIVGDAGS